MPVYTYECRKCKAKTDELQKISDPPPKMCPHCGTENSLERRMGLSNFQLKGSGWAKDGYS